MIIRNLFIFSILTFCFYSTAAQNPNKKLPPIKHGGYVIYEKNGHGLIASVENLGKMDYESAVKATDSLDVHGFSDWRLPTREEFELIHPKLNLKKVGGGNIFQSSCIGLAPR